MSVERIHGIPDELGYDLAESLGFEALCDLGSGSQGTVFALADGNVLKVTISANEAAIAVLLMQGRIVGRDLFPRMVMLHFGLLKLFALTFDRS